MARKADLSFLVDEVLFEAANKFPDESATAAAGALHRAADRGADLKRVKARLLSALPKIKHSSMQMNVAKALAHHAFRHDDADLMHALLKCDANTRRYVLQLDYRVRMTTTTVAALEAGTRSITPQERQWLFKSLQQQVQFYGGNLLAFVPALSKALGDKPSGRGYKRVDLAWHADSILVTMAKKQRAKKLIVEALQPIAAGKGLAATNAQATLAKIS